MYKKRLRVIRPENDTGGKLYPHKRTTHTLIRTHNIGIWCRTLVLPFYSTGGLDIFDTFRFVVVAAAASTLLGRSVYNFHLPITSGIVWKLICHSESL